MPSGRITRPPELLALDHVGKIYPNGVRALDGVTLTVARAFVMRPEVLLLDEPFSALDAFTRADLQDHLLDVWADTKPTLVIVTHDVDEAAVLADRIIVMRSRPGRLYEEIAADLPR